MAHRDKKCENWHFFKHVTKCCLIAVWSTSLGRGWTHYRCHTHRQWLKTTVHLMTASQHPLSWPPASMLSWTPNLQTNILTETVEYKVSYTLTVPFSQPTVEQWWFLTLIIWTNSPGWTWKPNTSWSGGGYRPNMLGKCWNISIWAAVMALSVGHPVQSQCSVTCCTAKWDPGCLISSIQWNGIVFANGRARSAQEKEAPWSRKIDSDHPNPSQCVK